MKRILLLDPSIASLNIGDSIIAQSIVDGMKPVIEGNFIVHYPTQTPLMHFYQRNDPRIQLAEKADFKFICGSNLFWQNMLSPFAGWNINIFNCALIRNSIFVGIGSGTGKRKMNAYTKLLYKKVLSQDMLHSTRDDFTRKALESLGYRAINTGCATTWMFTESFCSQIPTGQAQQVVFTLTDYQRDFIQDKMMIQILKEQYNDVYFWPQGYEDYQYLHELEEMDGIQIIDPSLNGFCQYLIHNDTDYIGTRLHGGIFAMQQKKRTIIISVDNRARDMRKSNNLNCLERNEIKKLPKWIQSEYITRAIAKEEACKIWLNQFL